MFVQLSTQSPDHSHPFSLKVNYAEDILAGKKVDNNFFGAVYTLPTDVDIHDESLWYLANPSIEAIPSIRKQIRKSLKTGEYNPAAMAQIRAYLFNQRYSGEVGFIGYDTWIKCKGEYDIKDLEGCKAWGGLDLSSGRNDLASLQLLVQGRDDDLYVVSYFWTAKDGLYERGERDGVNYVEWANDGYIDLMPGQTTDWSYMTKMLLDIAEIYDIEEIYYDRWKIYEIERELGELGEELPITPYGQGYRDADPMIGAFEEYLYERKIWHNNPCLTWNVANTIIEIDPAGLRKPSKKKSLSRIDGTVALGMSCRCHQMNNIHKVEEIIFV